MFSITCKACAARLKVRNVAIIGQTLGCPRCGQMIAVVAPEGFVPPAPSSGSALEAGSSEVSSESGMTGLTDFEDIQSAISDAVGKTVPPPDRPVSSSKKPVPDPGLSSLAMPPNRAAANQVFVAAESKRKRKVAAADAERFSKKDPTPAGPSGDWSSDRTRKQKRLFLILFGLVFLVASAIALVWAFSPSSMPGSGEIAQTGPQKSTGDSPDAPNAAGAVSDQESHESPADPNPADSTPSISQEDASPQASGSKDTNPADPNPVSGNVGQTENVPPPIDGLDSFPSDLFSPAPNGDNNLTGDPAGTQATLPGGRAQSGLLETSPDSIPDALGNLNQLLGAHGSSLVELGAEASLAGNSAPPGMPTFFVPRPNSVPLPNFEKALGLPVARIAYNQKPLSVVLRELSELSAVPVAWDIRAVIDADIDPQGLITIELTNTTIGDALKSAVAQAGLEILQLENQTWGLAVTPSENAKTETARISLAVTVPADETRIESLAKEIPMLVSPQSWADPANGFSVTVEGSELVVIHNRRTVREIRRLVEKINAVAADKKFAPASRNDRAQAILDRNATLKPAFSDSVESFLARLESETGMCVLIDWSTASTEGWNLNARIPGDFSGATNRQLLNRLGRSMELDWQPVSKNVFLLTTEKASHATTEVEVYAAGPLIQSGRLDSESVMRTFSETIGASLRRDTFTNVYFDNPTGCIVVAAPPNVQRQVEAVLNRLIHPPQKPDEPLFDNPLGLGN